MTEEDSGFSLAPYEALAGVLVMICDQDGYIREIIHDHLGLSLIEPVHMRLGAIAEAGSAVKLDAFLAEAWRQGASLGWELVLDIGQKPEPLLFFAVRRNDDLVVFATQAPQVTFSAFEEMLRLVGEQGVEIRFLRKQMLSSMPMPGPELEEFTRLNNELVNAQRDLARINLELQRQESRFRSLLRDLAVAVAVVNLEGVTRFVNASCAALFGRDEGDMLGRPFPLQLDGEAMACSGRYVTEVVRRTDGVDISIEIGCVRSSWEVESAHVLTLHDISARVKAETDRADVERILQHDLKAPLTAIINLPQIMRMDGTLSSEHSEYLTLIEAAGQRMLRMITQSLDLHRMERGEYHPEGKVTDLVDTVRATVDELLYLAQAKEIGIRFTVDGAEPVDGQRISVQGTPMHLAGVVSNLLANALEASPKGGQVSLELTAQTVPSQSGGFAILAIRNPGAVPEAVRDRFFEKYATYGKRGGTGLGTYSARLIARAHGGDVDFDSSDGVSTTLTVRLPLWRPDT